MNLGIPSWDLSSDIYKEHTVMMNSTMCRTDEDFWIGNDCFVFDFLEKNSRSNLSRKHCLDWIVSRGYLVSNGEASSTIFQWIRPADRQHFSGRFELLELVLPVDFDV